MDSNGNGKRGLPLLREIIRRQRQDSDVSEYNIFMLATTKLLRSMLCVC